MSISHLEPARRGDEEAVLRQQSQGASAAIRRVAREIRGDLLRASDPRGWARRYPWATLTAASAVGFIASWIVVPRKRAAQSRRRPSNVYKDSQGRRKPASFRRRSLSAFGATTRGVLGVVAQAVVAGGTGLVTGKAVRKQAATAAADGARRVVPAAGRRSVPDAHSGGPASRRSWWQLLKLTLSDWNEDKAPRLGAALAYYTVFSLAPLLVIAVALAGLFVDPEQAQSVLDEQVRGFLGEEGLSAVQAMVEGAQKPTGGIIATIVGVVALLFGASGVFGQLQDALNTIWEVEPKPGRGVWGFIRARFLSFAMVLGIGFLLLVSLIISSLLAVAGNMFRDVLPGPDAVSHAINFVVAFGVVTLLFAAIFKLLPDVQIRWRDVWIGAIGTALLFTIGKYAISLYLGYAAPSSSFGAVGSLIVVLLWTYYSAQILFLGAEFTQAYARMYGSRIVPDPHARFVTSDQRREEGLAA